MRRVLSSLTIILLLCAVCVVSAQTTDAIKRVVINYNTQGDKTLVVGVENKTIRVFSVNIYCNGANNLTFTDTDSATLLPVHNILSNGGFIFDYRPIPWFSAGRSESLVLTLSADQQCSGALYYTQD